MSTITSADHTTMEARFNAFLRLLDEPYGGKVLHAHYAADAPLSFKFEVKTAGELGPDTFALGHAASAILHEEQHPGVVRRPVIAQAILIALAEEPDGRRVAWFKADEGIDGQALYVAAGYVKEADEAWRIGWLTLAPRPEDWSYTDGRVQALADFPFVINASYAVPRSWLDLAWYRLYGHARPALDVLPEARFGCHGSGACCVKGFNTDVPAGAQALIDAIPWERHAPHLVGTRLEEVDTRRLRLKHRDDDCRFLDGDRRCLIHAIVGRSVFPVCTIYPMMFQETPDGVAVAMSPACPSARGNLGPPLGERVDDLYARLAMRSVASLDPYRLEAGSEPDWPAFKAAEAGLQAQLRRTDLPLARRLWLGSRWLDHAAAGQPIAPDAWTALDAEAGPQAHDPDGMRLLLIARFARHFELPLPETDTLTPRVLPAVTEEALANVFRNQLHGKKHGGKYGLRAAHHVNVLGYMLVRYVAARHPEGEVPERLFWQIGAALMHGAMGNILETQPDLLEMMTNPGFGSWLLGDPQPV